MEENFDLDKIRVRITYSEDDALYIAKSQEKLAMETENKVLPPDLVLNGVKNLMKKPKLGRYFIAEHLDPSINKWQAIGTSMTTFELQPRLGGIIYMIQSVYVDAAFRKKGVFRKIFSFIVNHAKADPFVKAIRLYVEHDNYTA